MGTYASVIVVPQDPPALSWFTRMVGQSRAVHRHVRPSSTSDLEATAHRIVELFARHGFLRRKLDRYPHCSVPSSATSALFEGADQNNAWAQQGTDWFHISIDSQDISPAISEIVFTMTNAESWEGLAIPEELNLRPDDLFVSHLEVFVFSWPVEVYDYMLDKFVCRPWAIVEFEFEDTRYREQIHCIRNEAHPLFDDLARVFGCRPHWHAVLC